MSDQALTTAPAAVSGFLAREACTKRPAQLAIARRYAGRTLTGSPALREGSGASAGPPTRSRT